MVEIARLLGIIHDEEQGAMESRTAVQERGKSHSRSRPIETVHTDVAVAVVHNGSPQTLDGRGRRIFSKKFLYSHK